MYGSAHGYDITLRPQLRPHVCVTALNVGPGADHGVGCGHEKDALSVMTLNLMGTYTDFNRDDGVGKVDIPWRDRYDRIALGLRETGDLPDILALQDVHMRRTGIGWTDPTDYESLFELIYRIYARTGVVYRIAYVATDAPLLTGAVIVNGGHAVLYNAARVHNDTAAVGYPTTTDDDNATVGVHMRTSYPCQGEKPQYAGWCSLLDGDGRYWTNPHVIQFHSHPGEDGDMYGKWDLGPQALLFSLVAEPGKYVRLINVHAHPTEDPGVSLNAIAVLATAADTAWATFPLLYPPIITGDFNTGHNDMVTETGSIGPFRDFDIAAWTDVDNVLMGRTARYPSARLPSVSSVSMPARSMDPVSSNCGSTVALWSDHCALFAQFVPRA